MKQRVGKILLIALIVLLFFAAAGAAIYFYFQYNDVLGDSKKAEEIRTQKMLAKIASVMDLPAEKPSIVTITDREKLQGQEFFKKALNGDVIIIYEAAKRVILYRPSTGRIVDVAPLIFNNQDNSVMPQNFLPEPTYMVPNESSPGATIPATPFVPMPSVTPAQ